MKSIPDAAGFIPIKRPSSPSCCRRARLAGPTRSGKLLPRSLEQPLFWSQGHRPWRGVLQHPCRTGSIAILCELQRGGSARRDERSLLVLQLLPVTLRKAPQRVDGTALLAGAGLDHAHGVQRLSEMPVVNALGELTLESAGQCMQGGQSAARLLVGHRKGALDLHGPLSVRHRGSAP